ncbi:MAG TPA: endo alpha-1,4 polygalactosaminidase [Polyangia bacterium]|nr:endo alpha-1,4 polygalactosaminidase [Polyangia bacterium]
MGENRPAGSRRRPFVFRLLVLVALLIPAASCRHAPVESGSDLARAQRWWILIGSSPLIEAVDWREAGRDTQVVILAGDTKIPLGDFGHGTTRLAYLSVGEADPKREYWNEVEGAQFLVEPDPAWPGSIRVDLRDPAWRRVLLKEEIPLLLGRGFDGLMLDTIDTAPYLERQDPARFLGMRKALKELVREIREQHPQTPMLVNGISALADVAPYVDGFVVEGVFATYDFGRRLYRETTAQERDWKLAQIGEALAVARRPVFTIEYADVGDVALGRWASGESERHGFHPYVGVKDLNMPP